VALSFAQQSAAPQEPATASKQAVANASTPVKVPAAEQANGGNAELTRLARQQGVSDSAALDWVLANSGPLTGNARAGELRIAFTITAAEGWWDKAGGGKLTWHDAPAGNMHLRIFVADLADGRLVPGLSVRATLLDSNGNEQSTPADFGWYPLLNAYGGNLPLDADSSYTLRVTVDPLPEHGPATGEHLAHATVAEFPPVQISRDTLAVLPLATATSAADEAELLKPCNAALTAAITALWQQSSSGAEQASGDYFAGFALDSSALITTIPGAELHIRNMLDLSGNSRVRVVVFPRDSRTGRLIPGLKPTADLVAADGKQYGPGELPLTWHAWFNHYGRGVRAPRNGVYKLRVHFDAPSFRRWGRQSERFAAPVDVEFDNVTLKAKAGGKN
jgi:hypothetical protein